MPEIDAERCVPGLQAAAGSYCGQCLHAVGEYGTFSAANMISFGKLNVPEFIMIPIGAVISLVGMGLGVGIKCLISQVKKKR